ncbi:hypothetical protein OSSY52_11160 [Tepiditoga spiralis]|uniref:Outer membrane efflux protein n=1 Tax=Tepiditoga spiralis TaxID=2108365 RepID=A0A7G1G4U2_9BACT|nr:hypothetical protein [Tepiditoga spiralis]BBE29897.1 hypothetical protein OSSY52_00380 [Tepiditoga spiralis]BBE30975.1 hypothetical protein OSSY52_11160 [Tepiditoga spiralis]
MSKIRIIIVLFIFLNSIIFGENLNYEKFDKAIKSMYLKEVKKTEDILNKYKMFFQNVSYNFGIDGDFSKLDFTTSQINLNWNIFSSGKNIAEMKINEVVNRIEELLDENKYFNKYISLRYEFFNRYQMQENLKLLNKYYDELLKITLPQNEIEKLKLEREKISTQIQKNDLKESFDNQNLNGFIFLILNKMQDVTFTYPKEYYEMKKLNELLNSYKLKDFKENYEYLIAKKEKEQNKYSKILTNNNEINFNLGANYDFKTNNYSLSFMMDYNYDVPFINFSGNGNYSNGHYNISSTINPVIKEQKKEENEKTLGEILAKVRDDYNKLLNQIEATENNLYIINLDIKISELEYEKNKEKKTDLEKILNERNIESTKLNYILNVVKYNLLVKTLIDTYYEKK